jgi:uncharacterized protein YicC (UPF0701 family)
MAHETETGAEADKRGADREILVTIQDRTRQTLELVKTLVELLVAKEGDREGPTLEELLAVLIAQQRDMLTGIQRLQTDVSAIVQNLLKQDAVGRKGGTYPNGSARP